MLKQTKFEDKTAKSTQLLLVLVGLHDFQIIASCMHEAWKQETYVRCQSFSSESAVKYLNLEQRKIQIYLPLGEQDQSHGQFVFAISNNSYKFQRQFPPNFQLLGIPRNSHCCFYLFLSIPKYSKVFYVSSFVCLGINWNS